jgi:hypothetical protein
MKSEERHRLKTNEFSKVAHKAGDVLEQHATTIVGVICAVLVVAAAVTWWFRQSSASSVSAWTLLESAQSVDEFGNVADKYKGTPAGDWARLRGAESNLRSGMELMFSDRELALTDLKRARESFEELLSGKRADSMIRERAQWGLARSLETTSDGDTTKAIEAYQQLLNEFPETVFKPMAEERIAALKTGGTKEFYAWFSKQQPKPADIRPKDGALKGLDGFKLPPPAGSEFDTKPEDKQTDTPAAKDTESSKDKPADETPKAEPAKESTDAAKPDSKPEATKDEKKTESDEKKPETKPEGESPAKP